MPWTDSHDWADPPTEKPSLGSDHQFALCLTHDVDRPVKRAVHALYYAARELDPQHLKDCLPRGNPYWQFADIARLERDLGVRSAFYVLSSPRLRERSLSDLLSPGEWVQLLGRYDVDWPPLARVLRALTSGGWEVGLHGSRAAATDRDRLAIEKERIESVLGEGPAGGRQHYLSLSIPETWRHYRALGLSYDASLGSATTYGFDNGYDLQYPFEDDFAVFPLTLMDQTLPDPATEFDAAWRVCTELLEEAAANGAIMTVLWHPRLFSERDFPGHRRLYRDLIEYALELDGWVGAPTTLYDHHVALDPAIAD